MIASGNRPWLTQDIVHDMPQDIQYSSWLSPMIPQDTVYMTDTEISEYECQRIYCTIRSGYDVTKQDTGYYMIAKLAKLWKIKSEYVRKIDIGNIAWFSRNMCSTLLPKDKLHNYHTQYTTWWSQNVVYEHKGYILRLPQDIQYCMIGTYSADWCRYM